MQIIAQTPEMQQELQLAFDTAYLRQAREISEQQALHPGARYVVIDAGFPRALWLVWDCEAHDNLRGHSRCPWFTTRNAAQKMADRHNRANV